jgi:hypothetical protein
MKAAIDALMLRGMQVFIHALALNKPRNADFCRGYVQALRDAQSGLGDRWVAKDERLAAQGFPDAFPTARAGLAVHLERAPVTEVQQFLVAHGIEVATHAVSDADFLRRSVLPQAEVPLVTADDEHATPSVAPEAGGGQ